MAGFKTDASMARKIRVKGHVVGVGSGESDSKSEMSDYVDGQIGNPGLLPKRRNMMKATRRPFSQGALLSAGLFMVLVGGGRVAQGAAEHVRWDILSLNATTTPPTLNPGGVAYASARNPSSLKIKLTGSGTFVAPASGGESSAVTGGGTWVTYSGCPGACTPTGSGAYEVTRLASWEFGNLATGAFIDNIADGERVNGNAVLRIQYSDGSSGVLGVLCHGAGGKDGIAEGVIATKDFVTYVDAEAPDGPSVDKNRTIFHFE